MIPKKTLAQNLNPILGKTFWYNPIFEKKTKIQFEKKTVKQKKDISQLDPQKTLAQNLNPIWENQFWYDPILKTGKSNETTAFL